MFKLKTLSRMARTSLKFHPWTLSVIFFLTLLVGIQWVLEILSITLVGVWNPGLTLTQLGEAFFPYRSAALALSLFLCVRISGHTRSPAIGAGTGYKQPLAAFGAGALWALGFLAIFLPTRIWIFLGSFWTSSLDGSIVGHFIAKTSVLLLLCFSQEWVFRRYLLKTFAKTLTPGLALTLSSALATLIMVKSIEFSWMQTVTIVLLQLRQGARALQGADENSLALQLFAFLFFTHCVFSLPLWGTEIVGPFLIKPTSHDRFLSGGTAGPFSGFAFQSVLFMDLFAQQRLKQWRNWFRI